MAKVGKNVEITTKGSIMTISVDLSKTFGRSATGKTIIVASTAGNKRIDYDGGKSEVVVGVNVYRYPEEK